MTESSDLESSYGYTRESVEAYLKSVAVQQLELEAALAAAKARIERVENLEQRIQTLESQIGHWVVTAHGIAEIQRSASVSGNGKSDGGSATESAFPAVSVVESPSGSLQVLPEAAMPTVEAAQKEITSEHNGVALVGGSSFSASYVGDGRENLV